MTVGAPGRVGHRQQTPPHLRPRLHQHQHPHLHPHRRPRQPLLRNHLSRHRPLRQRRRRPPAGAACTPEARWRTTPCPCTHKDMGEVGITERTARRASNAACNTRRTSVWCVRGGLLVHGRCVCVWLTQSNVGHVRAVLHPVLHDRQHFLQRHARPVVQLIKGHVHCAQQIIGDRVFIKQTDGDSTLRARWG
jgi:hypothetical protein